MNIGFLNSFFVVIEIVRDDTEIEIKNFNSRIDDKEADAFAQKFLTTLNVTFNLMKKTLIFC